MIYQANQITVFNFVLSSKLSTLYQTRWELDKDDFYFLQLYNFFAKIENILKFESYLFLGFVKKNKNLESFIHM